MHRAHELALSENVRRRGELERLQARRRRIDPPPEEPTVRQAIAAGTVTVARNAYLLAAGVALSARGANEGREARVSSVSGTSSSTDQTHHGDSEPSFGFVPREDGVHDSCSRAWK